MWALQHNLSGEFRSVRAFPKESTSAVVKMILTNKLVLVKLNIGTPEPHQTLRNVRGYSAHIHLTGVLHRRYLGRASSQTELRHDGRRNLYAHAANVFRDQLLA